MEKVYVFQHISVKNDRENPIYTETEVFTSKDKALSKLEEEFVDYTDGYDITEEDVDLEEGVIKAYSFSTDERGYSLLTDLFVIEKEIKD